MSESPNAMFRELFVELPHAVFEALQGIGEQAVREAQKPKPQGRDRLLTTDGLDWFGRLLHQRYGWRDSRVEVMAERDAWGFVVRLACGHRHRIEVHAETLFVEPTDNARAVSLIDLLDRHVHERSCYCTPQQEIA